MFKVILLLLIAGVCLAQEPKQRETRQVYRPQPFFVPGRNPPGQFYRPDFNNGFNRPSRPVNGPPHVAVPLPIRVRRQIAVTLPAIIRPEVDNGQVSPTITNPPTGGFGSGGRFGGGFGGGNFGGGFGSGGGRFGIMPVRAAVGQMRSAVRQGFDGFGGSVQTLNFPRLDPAFSSIQPAFRLRRQNAGRPLLGSNFGGSAGGGFVGTADGFQTGVAVQPTFPIINRPAGGQARGGGFVGTADGAMSGFAVQTPFPIVNRPAGGQFRGGLGGSGGEISGGFVTRNFGGQGVPGERGRFGGNQGRGGGQFQFSF